VIKLGEQTAELYQQTESILGSRDTTLLERLTSTLEAVKKEKVSVGCFGEPGLGKSSMGNR
jgi:predicted GTPase